MDKIRRPRRGQVTPDTVSRDDLGKTISLMTQSRRDEILAKIITKRRPA